MAVLRNQGSFLSLPRILREYSRRENAFDLDKKIDRHKIKCRSETETFGRMQKFETGLEIAEKMQRGSSKEIGLWQL